MHRKRSAVEPPEALLEREPSLPVNARRPASISLGAAFVLVRAIAGVLWLAGLTLEWREIAEAFDLDRDESAIVYALLTTINGGSVLVLAVFAWLIWRGSNTARVIAMSVLTISIMSSAVSYFATGEQITVRTTLLTVALDILVLLALSSRDARAWARRPRR